MIGSLQLLVNYFTATNIHTRLMTPKTLDFKHSLITYQQSILGQCQYY